MKEKYLVYQTETGELVGESCTLEGAFDLARELRDRESHTYHVTHVVEAIVQTFTKSGHRIG